MRSGNWSSVWVVALVLALAACGAAPAPVPTGTAPSGQLAVPAGTTSTRTRPGTSETTPQGAVTTASCLPPQGEQKPPPMPTPDTRSSNERATEYVSGFNAFWARRAKWIEDFQAAGKDASTLCRSPIAASYVPGPPSLTAALQRADLVVEGAVTQVVYTPSGTVGTVRVTAVYKASDTAAAWLGTPRPAEVQVALGYGPEPGPDFSLDTGWLAFHENQPVLFPGARAILFLQLGQAANMPPFSMQSFTGGYEIDANGRIVPVPHNPFAAQVRGLPAGQFAALIATELGKLAP